jgi:uncharacterized protein (DUF433 family)
MEEFGAAPPGWPDCKLKLSLKPQQVLKRDMNESVFVRNPEILSGTPVFAGTRVPVRNLLDYLEGGYTLEEFLADFPGVTKAQVVAFLEQATAKLLAGLK